MNEKLSDCKREVLSIYQLCINNPYLANIYFQSLNSKSSIFILKSLISTQVPPCLLKCRDIITTKQYYWEISQILMRFYETNDFYQHNYNELFESELIRNKDKVFIAFQSALKRVEKNPNNNELIFQLGDQYLQLLRNRQGYAILVLPKIQKYFTKITLPEMIQHYMFHGFELFDDLSKINFTGYRFGYSPSNNKDYEALFQIPKVIMSSSIINNVQDSLVGNHIYPNVIPYSIDSKTRSLFESSLFKNIHFVDLIKNASKSAESNESAFKQASFFNDLSLWIYISNFKDFVSDYYKSDFNPIKFGKLQPQNSAAYDIIQRIDNDKTFLQTLQNYYGKIFSKEDLVEHSIPFLTRDFLDDLNIQLYKDIYNIKLLSLNDDDLSCDTDFIWGYSGLLISLSIISKEKDDEDEMKMQKIEWFFSQIKSKSTLQSLLVDLFSMIFLQKDSHYVCRISKAESFLTMILNLCNNKEFSSFVQFAHLLVQLSKVVSNDDLLNESLFSREKQLFDALERSDWVLAEKIASLDNVHLPFVNLYQNVQKYKNDKNSIQFDNNKDLLLCAEIGLSFENEKKALEISKSNPLAHEVIEKRLECDKNPLDIIDTIDPEVLNSINKKFIRLSSTKWDAIDIPNSLMKFQHITSFLSDLNALIPILLNEENLCTVHQAITTDPKKIIKQFLKEQKFNEALKLSSLLKINLFDIIIQDPSLPESMIELITKDYPIVRYAILFEKNEPIKENHISSENKVIFNMFELEKEKENKLEANINKEKYYHILKTKNKNENKIKDFHSNEDEIEFYYQTKQEFLSEEQILQKLKQLLSSNPMNIGLICDLSYLLPTDKYTKLIMDYICENTSQIMTINKIINNSSPISPNLYSFFYYYQKYYDESNEKIFYSFLIHHKYNEAKILYQIFNDNSWSKLIFEVMKIFPDSEKQLLDIIPGIMVQNTNNISNIEIQDDLELDENNNVISIKEIDIHLINKISSEFPNINFDKILFDYILNIDTNISQYEQVKSFKNNVNQVYELIHNKEKLSNTVISFYESLISSLEIDSLETEELSLQIINTIENHISNSFSNNQNFLSRIALIKSFLSYFPFNIYGYKYSLIDCGAEILQPICDLDFVDLLYKYQNVYKINTNEILDNYLYQCFQLSICNNDITNENQLCFYEKIIPFITHSMFYEPLFISMYLQTFPPTEEMLSLNCTISQNNHSINSYNSLVFSLETADATLSPCTAQLKYNYSSSNLFDDNSHFFNRIKNISMNQYAPIPSKSQARLILDYIDSNAPLDLIISVYSRIGKFQKSLYFLNFVQDEKEKENIFIHNIFEISIAHNTLLTLQRKFLHQEKLFLSLLPISGPHIKYEILYYLKNYKEAYKSIVEIFKENTDSSLSLKYLEKMQNCVENFKDSAEKDIIKDIEIQREYCIFIIDKKINDFQFHVFGDSLLKERMVLLLIKDNNFNLAAKIIDRYNLNLKSIGEQLCDYNISIDHINTFIEEIEKNFEFKLFEKISYFIIYRAIFVHKYNAIDELINSVSNLHYRCILFIQYQLIDEAAEIAFQNNFYDLYSIIGNLSHHLLKPNIFNKCTKLLSKYDF